MFALMSGTTKEIQFWGVGHSQLCHVGTENLNRDRREGQVQLS